MVNDDILIKYSRARGHSIDWPEQTRVMKERLKEMKLGFPGIGNDHISLIPVSKLNLGDIFIYDPYIESSARGDEAPIMLRIIDSDGYCYVEGIGCGEDLLRDPDRIKIRWKDEVPFPPINEDFLVYRVDVRPTMNGGPGYYYFFKSYRDFRK